MTSHVPSFYQQIHHVYHTVNDNVFENPLNLSKEELQVAVDIMRRWNPPNPTPVHASVCLYLASAVASKNLERVNLVKRYYYQHDWNTLAKAMVDIPDALRNVLDTLRYVAVTCGVPYSRDEIQQNIHFRGKGTMLGYGTFGTVYQRVMLPSHEVVVVKVYKNPLGEWSDMVREITALHVLQQTPQLPVPKLRFITRNSVGMTRCGDMSLHTFLESTRHTLTDEQATYLMDQVIDLVHEVHYLGVAHLDLKPQNFTVESKTLEVFLVDWNGASVNGYLDMLHAPAAYVTTWWYRSFDAHMNRKCTDRSRDLWSLACVLYEIWTRGRVLFFQHPKLEQAPFCPYKYAEFVCRRSSKIDLLPPHYQDLARMYFEDGGLKTARILVQNKKR